MAIRTNTNPRPLSLPRELQDILARNGMRAQVTASADGFALVVQGHDSPMLTYKITEKQMKAMTDWGTNSANRKAYNTFASVVAADFDMPKDFVHARNANGRVAMGLHGYRVGVGEYGRCSARPYPSYGWGGYQRPCMLGWMPRQQEGWHLRRVSGNAYGPSAPMTPRRPDGRMKPGELAAGGYGFYYKPSATAQAAGKDVLEELQIALSPAAPMRPDKPAIPYSTLIASDVYFTADKWSEVLSSHGIAIDAEARKMTIQSSALAADVQYDLTEEELSLIMDGTPEERPLDQRLDIINGIIKADFDEPVTMDMLNSDRMIDIAPKADLAQMGNGYAASQQRQQANAMPLDQAFERGGYGTGKWLEVLASHGIVVEHSSKTLTVENTDANVGLQYRLTDNDYAVIINDSIEEHDIELRVEVINDVIGKDFSTPLTMEMLNSKNPAVLTLKTESRQELDLQLKTNPSLQGLTGNERLQGMEGNQNYGNQQRLDGITIEPEYRKDAVTMDGKDLAYINPAKGWYREGRHGREVQVDSIRVEQTPDGKYQMTAVIEGEAVSREIKQKEYEKFLAVDDYHRMKMVSKMFKEVDMKDRYPVGIGTKIFAGMAAGLVVAQELARPNCGGVYLVPPSPFPVYHKPGVDSPADIAAREYNEMVSRTMHQRGAGVNM